MRNTSVFEHLENRRLLSAAAAPTVTTFNEHAGTAFTVNLGNFTTLAPGTNLQATIHWGDGTSSKGQLTSDGTVGSDEINFEVDSTHTYLHAGKHLIRTVVSQVGPITAGTKRNVATFNDKAIVSDSKTFLTGVISGTYSAAPTGVDTGGGFTFNGTGTAGVLDAVTATASITLPGFIAHGKAGGTLTLTTTDTTSPNAGSVTLQLTGPLEKGGAGLPSSLTYTITDGSGAFANATGKGSIALRLGTLADPSAFFFSIKSLVPST